MMKAHLRNIDRRVKDIIEVIHRKNHHIMQTLRVSAKSKPNTVAGAVAGVIREQGNVELQTVGAGALNQAVKAIAIARGFLAPSGVDLVCIPSFSDIEIDGAERTAIRLLVEPKAR